MGRASMRGIELINTRYPPPVVSLFEQVVDVLLRHVPGCSVAVMGSFSTGQAELAYESDRLVFVSDVDLLAIVPDQALPGVLARRRDLSVGLSNVERTVASVDQGFHIGLRYRGSSELPSFANMTHSVGYSLREEALWLIGPPPRLEAQPCGFRAGRCAAGLCNLLWVALTFARPTLWRPIRRSIICMQASLNWAFEDRRFVLYRSPLDQPEDVMNALSECVVIATEIATRYPDSCAEAVHDEEFDYFRLCPTQPSLLPRVLGAQLELAWQLGLRSHASEHAERAIALASLLGLTSSFDNLSPERTFLALRYELAARRYSLCPLFRRDRGTEYLVRFKPVDH